MPLKIENVKMFFEFCTLYTKNKEKTKEIRGQKGEKKQKRKKLEKLLKKKRGFVIITLKRKGKQKKNKRQSKEKRKERENGKTNLYCYVDT